MLGDAAFVGPRAFRLADVQDAVRAAENCHRGGDRSDHFVGNSRCNDLGDWRRDNRYDWRGYRNDHRDLFRGPRYFSPFPNYRYSRLSIGVYLGAPFYAQQFWIADPWTYRLPPAYPPYQWVRYYDDVMLIDTYTGEVADVIYDFFW